MNKGSRAWARFAFLACATGLALAFTGGAASAESTSGFESESVVELTLPSKFEAMKLQLRAEDYGVEFNDHYLRKNGDGTVTVVVIGTPAGLASLEDAGYELGAVIEGPAQWRENLAEREAAIVKEDRAQAAALDESTVSHEDEIVILRADYFENYAGRFLSVEAKTRLGRALPSGGNGTYDPTAPTLSLAWDTGPGTPIEETPSRPMSTNIDPDTTPDTYIEHRELVRIGDVGTTTPARPSKIRIGSSTGARAEGTVSTWLGGSIPPSAAGFFSDFTTRYMDPTEVLTQFHALAAEYPNISQLIPLPNKTNGYQRRAQATLGPLGTSFNQPAAAGVTDIRVTSTTGIAPGTVLVLGAGASQETRTVGSLLSGGSPAPNVRLTAALASAHAAGEQIIRSGTEVGSGSTASLSASTIVLTSTAWGHEGGNDTTVEIRDPAAASSPLAVSVTGRDILVSLGTDSAGQPTSTAAQVVAAINAAPAARALAKATTYRGNAGAGPAHRRTKVNLSDFLNASTGVAGSGITHDNSHVSREPFQNYVLRITKPSATPKVGVFLYCQQHAREWATPLTCLETASRLLENYAGDPLTRELVDNLDIFVLASSNPDGSHFSMYNFNNQRRNMTNYCVASGGKETDDPMAASFYEPGTSTTGATFTNTDPASRTAWGVDLNRNNTFATLFDGYIGASTSCINDTYTGPAEASEPEIRNELWIADTFSHIKFSNNIHSFGGYFMWAPGAYLPNRDEGAADHANIGVEKYFFEAGDRILTRIKQHRNTVILPERTGPIADVLYSAAGNSADEHWYNRGVIAYSFETGADRYFATQQTASAAGADRIRISTNTGGFQYLKAGDVLRVDVPPNQETRTVASVLSVGGTTPNVVFTAPLTLPHAAGARVEGAALQTGVGFQPDYVTEGKHEAMEFANGNYGLLESALAYSRDATPPQVDMTGPRASRTPVDTTFQFVNEPSVIRYTTDGSAPTSSSTAWDSTGPREPGQVFHITTTTTFRWLATDIKGNTSTGSARFAIDAVAPTTTATVEQSRGFASVTLTGNDSVATGGSGIDETRYRVNGGAWQTYSGSFSVIGQGSHTVEYYSVDEAGNTEATKSVTFEVTSGRAPAACRVVLQPSKLRAKEQTSVRVAVKLAGRSWEGARVALRGPGVSRTLTTNAAGTATARVKPSRAGSLQASVRANELTNGCRDSSRVQPPARSRVAGAQASGGSGGAGLTGRPN